MTPQPVPSKFSLRIASLASISLILAVCFSTYLSIGKGTFFGLDVSADSNMRLAQVRDWMSGQDWFDLTLRRFGYGGGTPMHWTRVADLGPAALLWLLSQFLNPTQSDMALTVIYPLLLLIPLGVSTMWAIRRMVPTHPNVEIAIIACVLIIQVESLWFNFMPGNIDHHNLQIIAFIIFLGACCGQRDFRSGALAGFCAVIGIIIGPDAAPGVIAAIAALGLLWLFDPAREGRFLAGLGIGTLVSTLLGGAIFMPRPLSATWCDSWTLPLGTIFTGLGAFLWLASILGNRIKNRFVLAGVAAVIGVGFLALMLKQFPSCTNPLPLDHPMLQRYWMSLMWENLPFWEIYKVSPLILASYAPLLLCILAFGVAIWKKWLLWVPTLPALAGLLATLTVAGLYTRGIPMAAAAGIALLGAVLAQALSQAENSTRRILAWLLTAPFVSVLIASTTLGLVAPKATAQAAAGRNPEVPFCMGKAEIAKINALPPGKIISPFGMTEYLMRYTKMQVMFAGYHRAYKENLEIMNWLIATPDVAKLAFAKHDIRYFSACTLSIQLPLMAKDHPGSFIAQAISSRPPSWLTPVVPLQDGGTLFRIDYEKDL
jgi:hypothetical protein